MLVATLTLGALTSCAIVSSRGKASLQVYQPRVLTLQAGRPVPTRDGGTYTPQVDETWHSDAEFRAVEHQLTAALEALAVKQDLK